MPHCLATSRTTTRKAAEKLLDGHHANLEYTFVQLVEDARLKSERVGQLAAQRIVRVIFVEFGQRAVEHRLADDEFADEIHDGVDARGVNAERAFDNGGRGRALPCTLGRLCVRAVIFGVRRGVGGLSFENVAEEFVLTGLDVAHALDAQFRDDRGNTATLGEALFGLGGSERSFDDLDSGGGGIIFRAQCNDSAATMENVANQLEGSGVHQAIWVDAQGDVVDGFAAMNRFGNHQLLVFGPCELSSDLLFRSFLFRLGGRS